MDGPRFPSIHFLPLPPEFFYWSLLSSKASLATGSGDQMRPAGAASIRAPPSVATICWECLKGVTDAVTHARSALSSLMRHRRFTSSKSTIFSHE
ncbi:hypothetical protein MRX96_056284 [Rhipicephalus microplus]